MGYQRRTMRVDVNAIPGGMTPEEALERRENEAYLAECFYGIPSSEEESLRERLGLSSNGRPSAQKF